MKTLASKLTGIGLSLGISTKKACWLPFGTLTLGGREHLSVSIEYRYLSSWQLDGSLIVPSEQGGRLKAHSSAEQKLVCQRVPMITWKMFAVFGVVNDEIETRVEHGSFRLHSLTTRPCQDRAGQDYLPTLVIGVIFVSTCRKVALVG